MVINAEEYVESLYGKDEQLEKASQRIRDQGMPEISVAPGYGRLLTLLVSMIKAQTVLEIGTLGGYSGICLARGLEGNGRLVSLELSSEHAEVARGNLAEAGLSDRVEIRVGQALDLLQQLDEEGKRFDLVFIDADKENYLNYLDWALQLGNSNAVIVADNSLMMKYGSVMDAAAQGSNVQKIREFNHRIVSDPRLASTILPAYDGLAIARVK
ncbi:O-methyltransferase [Paenibacillus sp. YYML68]|uniref:O-methyltransferase n=1 Tax=Paenibacillus sp. YYML68 TaxID=2909250 RepID=UPI002490E5EC|nr:O-methyltransferase [Paenibacillus sp. YYML68]